MESNWGKKIFINRLANLVSKDLNPEDDNQKLRKWWTMFKHRLQENMDETDLQDHKTGQKWGGGGKELTRGQA